MATPSSSLLVHQLANLNKQYRSEEILLFAPRQQLGTALGAALTREAEAAAGLTANTISEFANAWSALSLREKGLRPLQRGPRFFLTVTALSRIDAEARATFLGNRSVSGLAGPLAHTFDTLRRHEITAEDYRELTPTSERHAAQAQAYAAYEQLLHERSFYDRARLLKTAAAEIEAASSPLAGCVVALLDVVELSASSKRLGDVLLSGGGGSSPPAYRLGTDHVGLGTETSTPSAPPARVASVYSNLPRPTDATTTPSAVGRVAVEAEADLSADDAADIRCWTATGVRREIQAVFEDIVARQRPLDTVEIAFTSREPYLAQIDTLAERYDMPVSRSPGRALSATRPGQALKGFFDWIADGFPASQLIHLFRSGLLQIDEPIGSDGEHGQLDSGTAASLLGERRYGDETDRSAGYKQAFDCWIEELQEDLDALRDTQSDAPWLSDTIQERARQKSTVVTLLGIIKELLTLAHFSAHESVSPNSFASSAQMLLEQYGPTPMPSGPEDEHTPDEAARNRLIERLQEIEELQEAGTRPLRRLAAQMSSWVDLTPYIRAEAPRPGQAHVVPLESAGYANREHLYVVGLDATSMTPELTDDPLLSDDDRDRLSTAGQSVPLHANRAETQTWLTMRALSRHRGTVTLSASTYDLTEDDEVFEAPLFIRVQEALENADPPQGSKSVAHFPVSVEPERALSSLDLWTRPDTPPPDAMDDVLRDSYPWISNGLRAESARSSSRYTEYDGLLEPGSYSDLNPLKQRAPISAGRLETYARAPYAYFLRYVLGVQPVDERALDEVAWLDARDRGDILHKTFRDFMQTIKNEERRPNASDEDLLSHVFENRLKDKRKQIPPPSEVVYAATRRQLWNDARIFLHAEISRTDSHTPLAFEVGFGSAPHRREEQDFRDAATIDLVDPPFELRGRIDRIDGHDDDSVSLWDYKTGSSRNFDESDLLNGGQHLQWVLYACAYEALEQQPVARAGYFFTSTDEMGRRLTAPPASARLEAAQILRRMGAAISAGAFPVNDGDDLRYSFEALFPDVRTRQPQLRRKAWPDDRPAPPHIEQ